MINIPESKEVWAVGSDDIDDIHVYGIGVDKPSALAAFMALYTVDLTVLQVVRFLEGEWVEIPKLGPRQFNLAKLYYYETGHND